MREHLIPADDVLKECGSDGARGLDAAVFEERLEQNGPNRLKEAERTPLWIRFFQQMADPMVIMLIVAAVISAATSVVQGEADFADVVIIMFVVILNSVLGVVQEAKSEEALAALQEMAAATSKVIRDGKQVEVHSQDLVVGDVVILEAGDSVPADCRILESASMKVEEAALTGESVPVTKHADAISLPEGEDDVPLGDRKNMCYMGSTVVFGRGRAVVVATGMQTEMGKIAGAIAEAQDEETPLQVKLDELSHILTILVVIICAVVFLTGFFKHGMGFVSNLDLVLDTFMVAVALAVAAIPEGLVAVVTIVLSMGVTKMSQRHAIIRKLSAVETLGCTQIICSDKTGTLTQNRMTVVEHATENLTSHVRTMALASDAKWDEATGAALGEPTEAALVTDAAKLGFTTSHLSQSRPRIGEAPFDSGRKMMSVVVRGRDGVMQHTKGGPDVVLARCTRYLAEDGVVVDLRAGRARLAGAVSCGYVYVDGSSVGEIDETELKDRRILAEEGFVSVYAVVETRTGTILAGPDIQARGVAEDGSVFDDVLPDVTTALQEALDKGNADAHSLQQAMRRTLGRWVGRRLRRRPMIVPVVIEA